MSDYTIAVANVLHVLKDERGTSDMDAKVIATTLAAELKKVKGAGVKYRHADVVAACTAAGITLTKAEAGALALIDVKGRENV